jgi:hypothetical protein
MNMRTWQLIECLAQYDDHQQRGIPNSDELVWKQTVRHEELALWVEVVHMWSSLKKQVINTLERLKWITLATTKVKASKNIYDVFLYYKQM